ncbi:YktB family protein [Brevibacillus sp. SYSU BS000544]|uniref:YktB family protein n=1 Tax=Brevibacillus sp. SYSU BS000544 TaxID=3416443 RepID=UPI003CE4E6CB
MNDFKGFSQTDFDVFTIDGLDARMDALKSNIRPTFGVLAERLTPMLSVLTKEEMFPHIAKHARRTVNPPSDTWIAWAADKRGYKKHPHFQIGLWETHLFVWYAVIYESPFKQEIALAMQKNLKQIMKLIPDDFRWSPDHTDPMSKLQSELGKKGVEQYIHRLQTVKKAELLCGITIDRHDPVLTDGEKLMARLEETLEILSKLYLLCKPSVRV